jgi:hypothetical protein
MAAIRHTAARGTRTAGTGRRTPGAVDSPTAVPFSTLLNSHHAAQIALSPAEFPPNFC